MILGLFRWLPYEGIFFAGKQFFCRIFCRDRILHIPLYRGIHKYFIDEIDQADFFIAQTVSVIDQISETFDQMPVTLDQEKSFVALKEPEVNQTERGEQKYGKTPDHIQRKR